jgi:hypothetical protein
MSDETKPTPGPWRWVLLDGAGTPLEDSSDDGVQWGRLDAPDNRVVFVCTGPVVPTKADADLIADAWQLPQLREDNRAMLDLLRRWMQPVPLSKTDDLDRLEAETGALLDKHGPR